MKIKIILISLLAAVISSCASSTQSGGTGDLSQLQKLNNYSTSSHRKPVQIGEIRLDALKNTALSVGARSGLAKRSTQTNTTLKHQEKTLNSTFNFYPLLLAHHVLPPVLVEAQDTLNLVGTQSIRLADKVYKIQSQARFVTAPPTWRDYLWLNYKQPEVPDKTLLPKTRQEREIWQDYVERGWKQGLKQADTIFAENLARLKRDYEGMVLYRKLYAQNMVSAPFVAKTNLGITGDNSQLYIGDKVLRITALPHLNTDSRSWKPALGYVDSGQALKRPDPIALKKPVIITDKDGKEHAIYGK